MCLQVQRSGARLGPAVMFGSRKTWDLGHAPCLQELWKKDLSLDGEWGGGGGGEEGRRSEGEGGRRE